MSDALFHPPAERLERFAAGEVEPGDAEALESHLLGCAHCRAEVEEWRAVFSAITDLPEFAPTAGFATRVMARVRVRRPLALRVAAVGSRLLPRTRKQWALASATLALPTLVLGALVTWVLTQPWINVGAVVGFGLQRAGAFLATLPGEALAVLTRTGVGVWIGGAVQRLAAGGLAPIGVAAALFGALTIVSTLVLYRNLFRTPSRGGKGYASYSI